MVHLGFWVPGFEFRVKGLRSIIERVQVLGSRAKGYGFRVYGLGSRLAG
jgi:hypothetical protein